MVYGAKSRDIREKIRKRGVRFLPLLGVDIYLFSTTFMYFELMQKKGGVIRILNWTS